MPLTRETLERISEDACRAVAKYEGTPEWLHQYEVEMRKRLAIRAQDEREDR